MIELCYPYPQLLMVHIQPSSLYLQYGSYCENIYPDLSIYNMEVSLSYITRLIGVSLDAEEVIILLLHFNGVILYLQIDY